MIPLSQVAIKLTRGRTGGEAAIERAHTVGGLSGPTFGPAH